MGERRASVRQAQPKHAITGARSSKVGAIEAGCRPALADPEHTARGTGAGDTHVTEQEVADQLAAIARRFLGLTTLETRKNDIDDFPTVAIWSIKAALESAYELGKQAGAK